jgi:hypothetical protein
VNDDALDHDALDDDALDDDALDDDALDDDALADDDDTTVSSPGGTRPAVAGLGDEIDEKDRPALGSCTGADTTKKARGVLGSSGSNTSP